jgi:hypothetical protein
MFSRFSYIRRDRDSDEEEDEDKFKKSRNQGGAAGSLTAEDVESRKKLGQMLDGSEKVEELAKGIAEEAERKLKAKLDIPRPEGYCVECEDQMATLHCPQCEDLYCALCYQSQHRKGKRSVHVAKAVAVPTPAQPAAASAPASAPLPPPAPEAAAIGMEDQVDVGEEEAVSYGPAPPPADAPQKIDHGLTDSSIATNFKDRAMYIPVRLSLSERKQLRLLEAGLRVSEYTDKVDILSYGSKSKRIHAQIKEICSILCGLVVATDYTVGSALIRDRNFLDNAEFFQKIFEVGRRHKIMNPEKMRTEYGKLIYLLQDSVAPHIQELLQFSCKGPIKTVYTFFQEKNALAILEDPLIMTATREVTVSPLATATVRQQVRQLVKAKERAVEALCRKYARSDLTGDEIKWCLYSISDNNSFLTANRDPVEKMIAYLTTSFAPEHAEPNFSLSIHSGYGGARLSHDHTVQYHYVLQSLTLWREILNDFFKLWYLAESDLLDDSHSYHLSDTGQGLNRVQSAPRVYRAMSQILAKCQRKIGHWVGSSVIHLGDKNVPNALMFIDKYSQLSRILNPVVITLEQIEALTLKDGNILKYVNDTFGGVQILRKVILCDFFKHAFDGSGADNFFDAGSCIDGRLTSAWNWCSQIEKKPYHVIFKLTGFIGFDGDFQT